VKKQRVDEETINSMTNIAKDVSGKDLKQSAVENINNSIQNLKESAEASLKGEGIKRKKFTIFTKSKKKKQTFSKICEFKIFINF
jgi:UDP-N-acetyl-D-mannosaminuronate dehydrogenase